MQLEGYRTEVFTYQNATVRVHHPELSAEENARRMEKIKKATAHFMKEVLKTKGNADSHFSKA